MLSSDNVRELNPLLVSELNCTIVSNGYTVNLHHDIIFLQHVTCRRQRVYLVHQAARLVGCNLAGQEQASFTCHKSVRDHTAYTTIHVRNAERQLAQAASGEIQCCMQTCDQCRHTVMSEGMQLGKLPSTCCSTQQGQTGRKCYIKLTCFFWLESVA